MRTGAFYMHGRDKFYRPTFVFDGAVLDRLRREASPLIAAGNFLEMFAFYFRYIREVMFLPGQIEQWVVLIDTNNMSLDKFPRPLLFEFFDVS
mmetsp:Transcript_74739/g.103727  ORF Transcript_74739/g.103727 Transcript_74739/m.103727 type:complete len:93 (-) Transcript_74739:56-334(-)